MPDPHEVLGVDRTASAEQIRAAYRVLARVYHPDRHTDAPAEVRAEVEKRMADLNSAYMALLQGASRSQTPAANPAPKTKKARRKVWALVFAGLLALVTIQVVTNLSSRATKSPSATSPRTAALHGGATTTPPPSASAPPPNAPPSDTEPSASTLPSAALPDSSPATTASAAASSGVWCKTSAAPSNDGYQGDYEVYVHSNQPYTAMTASDAGDSWSDETDVSGSADVLLTSTSPGEPITVTVGPASCSTTA